jgi:hypothetical protein
MGSRSEAMMFGLIRSIKFGAAFVAAAALLVAASTQSYAQTGTAHINVVRVGLGVGVGGGDGTLTYQGRRYRLSVSGIGIGTFGIARAELVGTAFNLRHARNIAGTYTATGAGLAIAGGGAPAKRTRRYSRIARHPDWFSDFSRSGRYVNSIALVKGCRARSDS